MQFFVLICDSFLIKFVGQISNNYMILIKIHEIFKKNSTAIFRNNNNYFNNKKYDKKKKQKIPPMGIEPIS